MTESDALKMTTLHIQFEYVAPLSTVQVLGTSVRSPLQNGIRKSNLEEHIGFVSFSVSFLVLLAH